jgi:hypothetical protein
MPSGRRFEKIIELFPCENLLEEDIFDIIIRLAKILFTSSGFSIICSFNNSAVF